jgi:hypothetical protein
MAFRNTLDLELHRNTVATIQRGKIERDYVVYFLMFARAIQGIGMAMLPIAFSTLDKCRQMCWLLANNRILPRISLKKVETAQS